MAAKSDFTDQEWQEVVEAPMTAGLIVVTSAGGGTFRETWALAHSFADARKKHGQSQLLDEIVSTRPVFDRHRFGSDEELHDKGLQQLADVAQLLRTKAPDDVDPYREFVIGVATHVAEAHKEEGQAISPPEQAALDEIRSRMT
jgi:hypothetical protein